MSRVRRVPMPEGGAEERDVYMDIHHNCPNAAAFRRAMEDPDIDMLEFNISSHGFGMPANTPFVVTATVPCRVCGVLPSAWFEWAAPKLYLL